MRGAVPCAHVGLRGPRGVTLGPVELTVDPGPPLGVDGGPQHGVGASIAPVHHPEARPPSGGRLAAPAALGFFTGEQVAPSLKAEDLPVVGVPVAPKQGLAVGLAHGQQGAFVLLAQVRVVGQRGGDEGSRPLHAVGHRLHPQGVGRGAVDETRAHPPQAGAVGVGGSEDLAANARGRRAVAAAEVGELGLGERG